MLEAHLVTGDCGTPARPLEPVLADKHLLRQRLTEDLFPGTYSSECGIHLKMDWPFRHHTEQPGSLQCNS